MILAFIGTAGSGKTTLTGGEFGKYLSENGYRVAYVNLDTGVRKLPYTPPDLDVREKVTAWSLMDEGLGPNGGAIVKSYDILAEYTGEYAEKIRELDKESDYVLIDTPQARWRLSSSTSLGLSLWRPSQMPWGFIFSHLKCLGSPPTSALRCSSA